MRTRGIDWQEFKKELLTEEERREIEDKASLMCALINARKDRGITQQKLSAAVGVKQPFIANIENGKKDPSLSLFMKILRSLGKTVEIVDIKRNNKRRNSLSLSK